MKKVMPEASPFLDFHKGPVDWVGMENMEMSMRIQTEQGTCITPAYIDAFIDLKDLHTRGIHMSRLYQTTFDFSLGEFTPLSIKKTLQEFIQKHKNLSSRAKIRIKLSLGRIIPSLISGQRGWRKYPIKIHAQLQEDIFSLQMGCEIVYSSTCPCSSGLSRQLIQQSFSRDSKDESLISKEFVLDWIKRGQMATPHSQRSVADVFVLLRQGVTQLPYENFIEQIRKVLPTEVQASVKREDEQDFARINGENLMFCEDACRKIASTLQKDPLYSGYQVKVSHEESLHPHNAVSILSKQFQVI